MKIEFKNNVNRIICCILTITILLSSLGTSLFLLANASTDIWKGTETAPTNGKGTENDPYLISTPEELAYVIKKGGEGKFYKLTADIYLNDISKIDWQDGTVADGYTAKQWYNKNNISPFNGTLDGDGHTVYGMYITNETNEIGIALLPYIQEGGDNPTTIKNLGIDCAYVNAPNGFAGALIGETKWNNTTTINTCYVGKNVNVKGSVAGLFYSRGGTGVEISNSFSLGTVTGTSKYGVVGDCWGSTRTLTNSYVSGSAITTSHGLTCTNVYTTDGTGGENAMVLTSDNMKGEDALTNISKMVGLAECEAFTATASYPVLKIFGSIILDDDNDDEDEDEDISDSSFWNGTETAPTNGTGTENDPSLISTPEELAYVIKNGGEGKFYKLISDIYLNDISKIDWQNGTVADGYTAKQWYNKNNINPFNGTLDGDGHTVYGMYITNETNEIGIALLPYLQEGGDNPTTIKNLGVDCAFVNAPNGFAGAIVGETKWNNTTTINTCYVGKNVTVKGSVAGLFYSRGGTDVAISNSYSLGTVSGTSKYGIVGDCWGSIRTLTNSYVSGSPITTSHGLSCTNVYTTNETGGNGAIVLTSDKMQGQDALTNENKMHQLSDCGSFEPTADYPVLKVFGEENVPDSANPWDGSTKEPTGEGTEENPILITSPEELAYVIKKGGEGKFYKLTADIYLNDISKIDWQNGTVADGYTAKQWYNKNNINPFNGTLDGDGHTVYGMYITNKTNEIGIALLPYLQEGGDNPTTIKNLGVDCAFVNASNGFAGAFVGETKWNNTTIISTCYVGKNVTVKGTVAGLFYSRGGSGVEISDSYSLGTAIGTSKYGIVGDCWGGIRTIENSYVSGSSITTSNGLTCTNVYTTDGTGGNGAIVLTSDKMQGLDVLSDNTKMPLLEDSGVFVPTDTYPILKVFSTTSGDEDEEVPEGTIWSGKVAKKFNSGTGTETDPYIITNGAELAYAVKKKGFNGSYFKLTNDIYLNDVSNINWAENTENNKWIVNSEFNGYLDGDGHIVYGVWFPNDNVAESAGLISVFNSGSIKNIGVRYSQIRARVNAGAIVGITLKGGLKEIDKCFSDGTVTVSYTTTQNGGASGIIGQAGYEQADDLTLKISNCYSKAKLSGHSAERVNGIIGTSWISYYTIENCYSITYSPYTAQNEQTCSNMHKNGMELNEIYKNIYTDLRTPNEWENFTLVNNENMIGEAAKKYMSGLDYVNVFETVVNSTPKLKIFRTYTGEDVDISGDSEIYESGSGKKSDPFIIANAEQLRYLLQSDNTKGKYYEISHDIYLNDVSRSNWTLSNPKVWYSNSNSQMFEGYIDGKGHYIYGLYMNEEPAPYKDGIAWETSTTALFPMVSTTAVIRNIHIRKSYISGKGKVASIIGEILNTDNGLYTQVTACSADDTVVLKGQVVGGIALGWASRGLKLHYSYFTGKISSTDKERGNALVADIWGFDWELVQCYFVGYPAYRASITPSVISSNYGSYNMGNIKLLTVEEMTGLNAKKNMVDFEWGTVWKTVENDTPHLNVVPADKTVKVYDEGIKGRVWSGYRAKEYASGSGTEKDPYIIETPEQMLKLVAYDTDTKGKHYKLVADLKLNDTSSSNWEESAREWLAGENTFYGHFDGDGHVVSGLYFDTSYAVTGLFQRVSSGAVIEKLGVTKSYIRNFGDEKENSYAAAIAPYITGWEVAEFEPPLISQCFADHTVYIEAYNAGGLIGGVSHWIDVENCYFTGEVKGLYWAGQCMANIWNLTPSSVSNSYFASADGSPLAVHAGAKVIEIENVYHRGINYDVGGCVSIATMLIRGEKAKEYMPNLDYEKIWKTVEGGTPVLRCFNNAEKYSDTTMPEKVEISFAVQGGSQCESIYGYPSYTNLLVEELPVPTRYGYEFEGWHHFSGGYVLVKDGLFPEYSTVFHAKWKPISIIIDFEEDIDSKYDHNAATEQFKPGVGGYLTTYVNGGLKSMHVIEQNEIAPLFLLSYKNKLDVGSEYEMTIHMSTDSSTPIDGTIELLHANHPQIDSDIVGYEKVCEFSDVTRGKWVEYKVTFTANSPYLLMKPSKGNSLFFDDIQIVPTGKKGELGKIETMTTESSSGNLNLFVILGIVSVIVLAVITTTIILVIRKRKQ